VSTVAGYELCGVAHLMHPWGTPARDMDQLRAGIAAAPAEVLFHHTSQFRLRHPAAEELAPDDLSRWVAVTAQDAETAERLSFAVQSHATSAQTTRAALLEVLDRVPQKRRLAHDAPEGGGFVFLAALSVRFPLGRTVTSAGEALEALIEADASTWFHHLIEEPWFRGEASLPAWIDAQGEPRLARWLREEATGGLPIDKARARVMRRWRQSQIGRRLAESAGAPDHERRDAARRTLAHLVRRASSTEEPR